jgi:protein transport protein SEC13
MSTSVATFDTQHDDMIHDAQMDYYGKRLATCSSDKTIKIFDVTSGTPTQTAELVGHEGPVWQVAWAHPKFGSVLASCSYDRKVIIWRENDGTNSWVRVYEHKVHELSVNSLVWAPWEYGLMLACGSSDGSISVLSHRTESPNEWRVERFEAHTPGVLAVSWAPSTSPAALVQSGGAPNVAPPRLVSGGCDGLVKIWKPKTTDPSQGPGWECDAVLKEHNDWVRDVAWAPSIGLPTTSIASASQDGTVVIWSNQDHLTSTNWTKKVLDKFPETVWRVSWSVTGNILAVSSGDNKVTLWKESLGEYKCINVIEDNQQK